MLGGTGVTITGPCFEGIVTCKFDRINVVGVIVSNSSLLCVTPQMPRSGAIEVEVHVNNTIYKSTFFSSECTSFSVLL